MITRKVPVFTVTFSVLMSKNGYILFSLQQQEAEPDVPTPWSQWHLRHLPEIKQHLHLGNSTMPKVDIMTRNQPEEPHFLHPDRGKSIVFLPWAHSCIVLGRRQETLANLTLLFSFWEPTYGEPRYFHLQLLDGDRLVSGAADSIRLDVLGRREIF